MTANNVTALPLGPLDAERAELLLRVVDGLDPATLQWLSGFAAGVAHERAGGRAVNAAAFAGATVAVPAVRPEAAGRVTIVYGSQTGNGKRIAEKVGRAAEAAGLAARVYASGTYPLKDLAKERLLVVVVSTQGDGDPPDDARGFIEFLASKRAPRLEQLAFSVLALGDSSYPKFCETGRQVDERLAALGARRLLDRVDCDVDYESLATPWLDRVVTNARDVLGGPQVASVTRLRAAPAEPQFSREQPFAAEVLANQRITRATPPATCATSRSRSQPPASVTSPATRWASGMRIRHPSSPTCSRRCVSKASSPSNWKVRPGRCANG